MAVTCYYAFASVSVCREKSQSSLLHLVQYQRLANQSVCTCHNLAPEFLLDATPGFWLGWCCGRQQRTQVAGLHSGESSHSSNSNRWWVRHGQPAEPSMHVARMMLLLLLQWHSDTTHNNA